MIKDVKKSVMKNSYVFIFIFALNFLLPCYGQEGRGNGRVFGYVVNEEGKPISGVKVLMKSTSYDFKLETISDQNGKWTLIGFGKDVFRFTFSKQGYDTVNSQIQLSGINRNPEQRIVMKKISPQQSSLLARPEAKIELEKAVQFYEEEKYTDALELFKEIVDAYPNNYQARYNLASTYLKLKQYDAAISEFQKVLETLQEKREDREAKKKSAEIYTLIAEAYMDQQKYEEAAIHYKKAMEISPPTDAAVAFNVAEIMFGANKIDDAIRYYALASQLKPENEVYHLKLGYACLNKGDIPTAISHFEEFLELAPDNPQAESIRNLIQSLKH